MPLNCPDFKTDLHACDDCARDGYCVHFCPPKEARVLISTILTTEEKIAILEDRCDFLEDIIKTSKPLMASLMKQTIHRTTENEKQISALLEKINNLLSKKKQLNKDII